MLQVVLLFLMLALLLYVLLAGADFGAGIIELFSSKQSKGDTKTTVYRVMGPVWEANHIWIIIVAVILWVGFPKFYNILVVYLHIPLTLVLLGITLRGVSFVFRHYDAFKDKSQVVYDWMFRLSSLITPIFLGMTFGAMVSGYIHTTNVNMSFYQLFIHPWCNLFSILIGLFFAALCTFLAAVLLIGEAAEGQRNRYITKAKIANIVVVVIGGMVLVYGAVYNYRFVTEFTSNPYAIALVALSGIIIIPVSYSIKKGAKIKSRFFAGVQVVLILLAGTLAHYPNLLITADSDVSLVAMASAPKVIQSLGITLILASLLILPGLFHLFKSFKMIKILEKF